MAITSISKEEFNQIFTFDRELVPYIGDELEWYANDAKSLIGVVARRCLDSCCNYAILRRSVLGDFVVATLSRDFMDLQTARVACRQEMAAPWRDTLGWVGIRSNDRPVTNVAQSRRQPIRRRRTRRPWDP